MTTTTKREGAEAAHYQDRLRELIPRYIRDGLLRRIGQTDGGVQFVEPSTDRVFATFDGQGRLVV